MAIEFAKRGAQVVLAGRTTETNKVLLGPIGKTLQHRNIAISNPAPAELAAIRR